MTTRAHRDARAPQQGASTQGNASSNPDHGDGARQDVLAGQAVAATDVETPRQDVARSAVCAFGSDDDIAALRIAADMLADGGWWRTQPFPGCHSDALTHLQSAAAPKLDDPAGLDELAISVDLDDAIAGLEPVMARVDPAWVDAHIRPALHKAAQKQRVLAAMGLVDQYGTRAFAASDLGSVAQAIDGAVSCVQAFERSRWIERPQVGASHHGQGTR